MPITDKDGGDASIATGADPVPASGVASDAVEGSDGIADGDVSPNVVDMVPNDRRKLNYWQETEKYWVFHKIRLSRCVVKPHLRGTGTNGGPQEGSFIGASKTVATFNSGLCLTVEDGFDTKCSYAPEQQKDVNHINREPWTGSRTLKRTPILLLSRHLRSQCP